MKYGEGFFVDDPAQLPNQRDCSSDRGRTCCPQLGRRGDGNNQLHLENVTCCRSPKVEATHSKILGGSKIGEGARVCVGSREGGGKQKQIRRKRKSCLLSPYVCVRAHVRVRVAWVRAHEEQEVEEEKEQMTHVIFTTCLNSAVPHTNRLIGADSVAGRVDVVVVGGGGGGGDLRHMLGPKLLVLFGHGQKAELLNDATFLPGK